MRARLRPARRPRRHEPGAHPARLHQGVHQRARSSTTCRRASVAAHERVRATATCCWSRAPAMPAWARSIGLSNAAGGAHARGARGHRQRGRRRPADRRDRAQPRPVRAPRRGGRGRGRQQGGCRRSPDAARHPCAKGWPATASSCWACCPTGRCSRTQRCRCSSSRCPARCSSRGPTWIGSSSTWPSAPCSRATCIERIGPGQPADRARRPRRTSSTRSSRPTAPRVQGGEAGIFARRQQVFGRASRDARPGRARRAWSSPAATGRAARAGGHSRRRLFALAVDAGHLRGGVARSTTCSSRPIPPIARRSSSARARRGAPRRRSRARVFQ